MDSNTCFFPDSAGKKGSPDGEQFLVLAFAQLTWRESLRDIETCLASFGTNFSNAAIAGMSADPDGDGVPNLLEFAVGGNPLAADATNAVVRGLQFTANQFAFQFLQHNPPASVTVQFQSSGDLLNWTNTTPASVNVLRRNSKGGVTQVEAGKCSG